MKRIHFAPNLVPLVLSGKKTSTWRLWDDKDLTKGDVVEFANSETREVFAQAELTDVIEKPFKDLTDEEKTGHEKYTNEEKLFKTFEKYYGKPVDKNTIFKIIHFKLVSFDNFDKLLNEYKNIQHEVKTLIDKYPEEKREKIIFDKWSLKDVVAHLNHWMEHDINCLENLLSGTEPHWYPDVEEFNKSGVDSRKNKTWDEVYEEFISLSENLIKLYKDLPINLRNKSFWKNRNETPITFLDEDISHWQGEHIPSLKDHL